MPRSRSGIGAIPNAVLDSLRGHRDLGIHTELLSDGVVDLVERGVVTGTRKTLRPNKVVTTFALGTQRLYDWMHENSALELLPVDYVNNPRTIARERQLRLHQRHHGSRPARPVRVGDHGGPLLVVQRRPGRFRPRRHVLRGRSGVHRPALDDIGWPLAHPCALSEGSVVTTLKNTVDHVVTEWGVAELRGRSISRRAHALVAIAHPDHRDALEAEARAAGLWGAVTTTGGSHVHHRHPFSETPVEDAMHRGIVTAPVDATVSEVAATLVRARIHCVVVGVILRRNGAEHLTWGVLSDLDLMAAITSGDTRRRQPRRHRR